MQTNTIKKQNPSTKKQTKNKQTKNHHKPPHQKKKQTTNTHHHETGYWLLNKSHTDPELVKFLQSSLPRNFWVKYSSKLGILSNFEIQKAVYESIKKPRYSTLRLVQFSKRWHSICFFFSGLCFCLVSFFPSASLAQLAQSTWDGYKKLKQFFLHLLHLNMLLNYHTFPEPSPSIENNTHTAILRIIKLHR